MHALLPTLILLLLGAPALADLTGLDYPAGTFVYAHYYPEDYYNQFHVIPIDVMVVDENVSKHVDLTNPLDHIPDKELRDIHVANAAIFENHVAEAIENARFTSIDEFQPDKDYPEREYKTYVRWAGDAMGYGLFCRESFNQHDFINIYAGMVMRNQDCKNTDYAWKFNWNAQYNTTQGEPVKLLTDGLRYGNELRFVNHGSADQLNVGTHDVAHGDLWYKVYQATKDAEMHEQLFVSYGSNYWSTRKHKAA